LSLDFFYKGAFGSLFSSSIGLVCSSRTSNINAKVQDKPQGPTQVEEHAFQDFGMLSNNYLFQGEPFNEICNT
jgi:hypothetical protein